MKIELNHREYITELYTKKYTVRCPYCAWRFIPEQYCVKFCRTGYIFKTTRIAPSIFHL